MKTRLQLECSIERFQRGFWAREPLARPPVAVVPDRVWSPVSFLRRPLGKPELASHEVGRALAATEYEVAFERRAVVSDDLIPYAAAWRAVPWLEAMCGCAVRYAGGSFAPHRFAPDAAALAGLEIPAKREWIDCLRRETAALASNLPEDCWMSTTILRGCADVLAAMRGIDAFCLDLHDDPGGIAAAAERVNRLHLEVLAMHFSLVAPKLGGYGHIFGYWAPGPTTVLQEDVMGLCSPSLYRDLFMRRNAAIVERLGGCVLFHLHSTGYRHYRHVLDIPGIAGLEITVEANGPPLASMLPALREILERSRLILMIDGWFGELPAVLRKLPKEGLYLLVSDKFIADDDGFRRFVETNW